MSRRRSEQLAQSARARVERTIGRMTVQPGADAAVPPRQPSLEPRPALGKKPLVTFALDHFDIDAFVAATLAEDLGDKGDITSAAMIPADARFTGVMDSREAIVVAGLPVAEAFFRALDPEVTIERCAREGEGADAGADLLH